MTDADFKAQLKQQLPDLLRQDAEIRALVLQTVDHYFANRQETESRFDRVLAELQRDREAQSRKWDEQALKWDEQNRKWDENTRQWNETLARMDRDHEAQTLKWNEQALKWDEQNRKWDENARRQNETLAEIKAMNRKHDSTIGALGSRWGL